MLTFKELLMQSIITEEMHQELKSILDEPESDRYSTAVNGHQKKLNRFVKKFKELTTNNIDTGLEDGKPKKGSSRAVFFPKEPKQIHIDGKPTSQHTAVKVAFPGNLDQYTGDAKLLGEHQNNIESAWYTRNVHSMLREVGSGHYTYNENGITAPVFDSHPDNHWLEMAKSDKLTKAKFKSLTKCDTHPKGLDFDEFTSALREDHSLAHGQRRASSGLSGEESDHIRQHPLYESTQEFMYNTGNHPGELRLQNYGIWKHPITGKEHPVVRDYGFSNDIAKLYSQAQHKKFNILERKK
jgi:hypothetical protein